MLKFIRYISHQNNDKKLLIVLSTLMVCILYPMSFFRLYSNDYAMAILDLAMASSAALMGYLAYHNRHTENTKLVASFMITAGMIGACILVEGSLFYWLYPGTVALFSLVKPIRAVLLSILAAVAIIPATYHATEVFEYLVLYLTLFSTVLFIFMFYKELNSTKQSLNDVSNIDFLTGARSRRSFQLAAEDCVMALQGKKRNSALIVFDIDNFKLINDKHGHVVGDLVLTSVCDLMSKRLRTNDNLFRLGGEEFAILLPEAELQNAATLSNNLQKFLAANQNEELPKITVSFGVSQLMSNETVSEWLTRTDLAMYESKNKGRDQISFSFN